MFRLIMAVALIALLKTFNAMGQDLAAEPLGRGGRGDGTLPLGETEAADGTLPLRLPADGTLPLRLRGDSGNMIGGARVPTQVVITQAIQRAMDPVLGQSLRCQNDNVNVSRHVAAGSVSVGDQTFTLKGICYDHQTKNMELVAERRVAGQPVIQSFMIGLLPAAEPREFQGRMTIAGQAPQAQRFTFNMQTMSNPAIPDNRQ